MQGRLWLRAVAVAAAVIGGGAPRKRGRSLGRKQYGGHENHPSPTELPDATNQKLGLGLELGLGLGKTKLYSLEDSSGKYTLVASSESDAQG